MAKRIYFGKAGFPGGTPEATDNKQGQPKQQTYYGDHPVVKSSVSYETGTSDYPGSKTARVIFGDGTDRGYNVTTETFGSGERYINERGKRNGVMVDIDHVVSPEGIVLQNDTSYNGLTRGDIGFEQLQRQFEAPIEEQEEQAPAEQPGLLQRFNNAVRRGISGPIFGRAQQYKQGGYLRLQKQGGKLTEVWTPFN